MTTPAPPAAAYTDAVTLHPHLLLGSVQLLGWLLCHPSAWYHHLARLVPPLPPDFTLAELTRAQWKDPAVHRLLLMGYGIWPLLTDLLVGLTRWGLGSPWEEIVAGMGYGLAVSVLAGLAVGLAVGVAPGIVAGVLGGLIVGVLGGVAREQIGVVPISVGGGLALGIIGSVAGHVATSAARRQPRYSITRQLSGTLIGVLISAAAHLMAAGVAWLLTGSVRGRTGFGLASSIAIVIAVGSTVGWRLHRWRGQSPFKPMDGLSVGLLIGVAIIVAANVAGSASGRLAGVVLYAALSALPYVLAERIAGPWAGAVAGALGSGGIYLVFLIMMGRYPFWPILPLRLLCIVAGLALGWWRPLILYPALMAWNLLLLHLDERRAPGRPSLLRWHAAFWDELQRLPLIGLDEYVVLVATRDPAEGEAAMAYLTTGRQRWAAQAAHIELEARRLEQCADASAIGHMHRHLTDRELPGPATALFRRVSRISQDIDAALQQTRPYTQRLGLRAAEERLDALVRELTQSSEPYAERFRRIVMRWQETVADHQRQLAEAVERRQEIESPYIIGIPLTEQQELFVGRTDISARIEGLLLDRRGPPILLYGQRRMGKTSLLNNLGRLLPSTIIPLFVDLQGPASSASDHAGFLYNIARAMQESAWRRRGFNLPRLSREALAADPFTRFDEWLDDVEDALGGNTALITLDEFEALDAALSTDRLSEARVLGMLRHLIQHRPRFKVLLAGSHTLEELQRWASYLINVQVLHLSYLSDPIARQLIERPVKDFALRYEPQATRRILDLSRGHPFLVQLLCTEVVALKNEQALAQRRLASRADIEAAIPKALDHGAFFFADMQRNQVDASGEAVLRRLAAYGEGAIVDRAALAHHHPDPAGLEHALTRLSRRELIEPVDNGYRFQVELIRCWFARPAHRP